MKKKKRAHLYRFIASDSFLDDHIHLSPYHIICLQNIAWKEGKMPIWYNCVGVGVNVGEKTVFRDPTHTTTRSVGEGEKTEKKKQTINCGNTKRNGIHPFFFLLPCPITIERWAWKRRNFVEGFKKIWTRATQHPSNESTWMLIKRKKGRRRQIKWMNIRILWKEIILYNHKDSGNGTAYSLGVRVCFRCRSCSAPTPSLQRVCWSSARKERGIRRAHWEPAAQSQDPRHSWWWTFGKSPRH